MNLLKVLTYKGRKGRFSVFDVSISINLFPYRRGHVWNRKGHDLISPSEKIVLYQYVKAIHRLMDFFSISLRFEEQL